VVMPSAFPPPLAIDVAPRGATVPGGVTIYFPRMILRLSPCLVHAFIDEQNLFHAVKRGFAYTFPNDDPRPTPRAWPPVRPGVRRVAGDRATPDVLPCSGSRGQLVQALCTTKAL